MTMEPVFAHITAQTIIRTFNFFVACIAPPTMVLLQYTYVGVANSNLNETALIDKSWDLRHSSGILSIMQ